MSRRYKKLAMTFTDGFIESRLGALPSPFDPRALEYMRLATLEDALATPEEYTGLDEFSPTNFGRTQGTNPSCVGWDWNYVYETMLTLLLKNRPDFVMDILRLATQDMSAGWAYQQSRKHSIPPVPSHVEGSTNLGAVRAAEKVGLCTEASVPTDITAPFDKIVETPELYNEALNYRISSYHNIPNDPESIKAAIYGVLHELPYTMPDGSPGKCPLIAAFPVYANFKDSYDNGVVPMPEGRLLGGHSSPIFGWKLIDGKPHWINFGSWGTNIADNGIFYIPFDHPFYPNDWWLMKIMGGAPTPPPPEPSNCPVAKAWTGIYNVSNSLVGGKTRLRAIVPRR